MKILLNLKCKSVQSLLVMSNKTLEIRVDTKELKSSEVVISITKLTQDLVWDSNVREKLARFFFLVKIQDVNFRGFFP